MSRVRYEINHYSIGNYMKYFLGALLLSGVLFLGAQDTQGNTPEKTALNKTPIRQETVVITVTQQETSLFDTSLSVGRIEDEEIAVAIGLGAQLHHLAAAHRIERDQFVDAVEIPAVVRRRLVMPFHHAGVGIDAQRRGGVEVVAGAQVAVPWGRIAGAHEDQVGIGIVGAAQPGGAAAGRHVTLNTPPTLYKVQGLGPRSAPTFGGRAASCGSI